MDDAAIQSLKIKINNIIHALDSQIQVCDKKIDSSNYVIEVAKRNLKQNTEMIVLIETNLKECDDIKNSNEAKRIGLLTSKITLIGQIAHLNQEMNDIKKEIERRTSPGAIAWDVFNHIFNPLGAAVSDVVRKLYDDLNEKVKKVAENEKEVNDKMAQIDELDKSINQVASSESQLKTTYDKLKQEMDKVTQNLKQNGIDKTNAENLKLELETFKTQANALLFKCESGKEVLEYGINEVDKLEIQVRDLFNKNHFQITF